MIVIEPNTTLEQAVRQHLELKHREGEIERDLREALVRGSWDEICGLLRLRSEAQRDLDIVLAWIRRFPSLPALAG